MHLVTESAHGPVPVRAAGAVRAARRHGPVRARRRHARRQVDRRHAARGCRPLARADGRGGRGRSSTGPGVYGVKCRSGYDVGMVGLLVVGDDPPNFVAGAAGAPSARGQHGVPGDVRRRSAASCTSRIARTDAAAQGSIVTTTRRLAHAPFAVSLLATGSPRPAHRPRTARDRRRAEPRKLLSGPTSRGPAKAGWLPAASPLASV